MCRTKDVVEKNVAGFFVGSIASGHATFKEDMALHANAGCRGGGLAHVVGLYRPLRDQHVSLFLKRFAHKEFKLAGLVAACCQACAVVAFDE